VRRLLVVLVVLGAILVGADRIAEFAAARAVAHQLRSSEHLARDPQVHFAGFPFLTQALRGRFSEVDLTATDVQTAAVPVARVSVRLLGVHASVARALAGRLRSVPVDSVSGTGLLRYADLASVLSRTLAGVVSGGVTGGVTGGVRLRDAGGRLAISGRASIGGSTVPVEVDCTVAVVGSSIRVVPQLAVLPVLGSQTLPASVQQQLAVTIPADRLPFGVRVRSVAVRPEGLVVHGTSTGFVLPA